MSSFYSDRLNGPAPRTNDVIPEVTHTGLRALAERYFTANYVAATYPGQCPDGNGIAGTDYLNLGAELGALIPGMGWPLRWEGADDATLFDVLEFLAEIASKPTNDGWHSYYRHHELRFDRKEGINDLTRDVNRLLARGGAAYELTRAGKIERLGSAETSKTLNALRPETGDATLDDLIVTGRELFRSRHLSERRTALEKLWDGFERLKTVEHPSKPQGVKLLLSHIPDEIFRATIEAEMTAVTTFGNSFRIRHHETTQTELPADALDYAAGRIGNLLVYLLRVSNRLA